MIRWSRARRRRAAARAAYVGGFLLFLTGGAGGVAAVQAGWQRLQDLAPSLGQLVAPLFAAALVVAAFGGLSVMAAGHWIDERRWFLAHAFLLLGTGVGLLSLVVYLVAAWGTGSNPARAALALAASVQGVGVLLAVFAQVAANRATLR